MNKSRILSLLNQIELIIGAICNTGYTIQPGDEEAIFNRTKAIADEVSAPPKSNADRIRQMTDEELFVFLNEITDCCFSNKDCDNCPMKYYYRCNIEAWLKQEVSEDAGSKTD